MYRCHDREKPLHDHTFEELALYTVRLEKRVAELKDHYEKLMEPIYVGDYLSSSDLDDLANEAGYNIQYDDWR